MLKSGCTVALLAVVVSLTIPAAAQSPNPVGMSSAAMPAAMPSVAPLFIESADFSSVLNLVNELRVPLQATVDVYSLDGVKAASETITMAPYSSRQLSMESIFAGAVPLQLGSIRVNADHTSGLLAALSLTHRGSPATYFDEELAMPSMEGSSVARGVADDAGGGTPITAITSLSSSPQNLTLSCAPENGAAQQRTLALGPNQTLLTRPCAGDLPAAVLSPSDIENGGSSNSASGSRAAAAVSVISDAMPGEFAVYGIVPHGSKDSPFFTSINFSDPKTRRSSGSTYVGVPVGPSTLLTDGSYSPEISIANFGPTAATITLESASTVNGAPQRITLATIVLAGGESKTVPLSNMPLSPGLTNGLRIHTDAAPGDVLSKLVSRGGSQLPVVEMLDKDERGAFNGGGHPWDVEPGVTSTLLLFNGDSTPQKVNLRFGTATGPWMRRFTLEPMETRAININELVGMQEKDDSGLALPSNAQSGELGWQSDSTWVSGRLLQTSAALGMARSFSCSQWVYACAFYLSPTPSLTLYLNNVGDLSEIPDWAIYTGFHPPTTCSCANPTSGNTTLYDSWQSGNTSIATITSGGNSSTSVWNGAGVGSTTSYFYGNNMFQGGGSLQCQASQPANVAPVITSISPAQGAAAATTSVTILGSGFGTSPTVSITGGLTVSITSSTSTRIVASVSIPGTAPGGNQGLTVTAQTQKSNPANLFVQIPTTLIRATYPGTSPAGAPGGYGPLITITNGNVVNAAGVVLATNRCGVFRNLAYSVVDQRKPGQVIQGPTNVTISESFSGYSGCCGTPQPFDAVVSLDGAPNADLLDTQYIGAAVPLCLGQNQNQTFFQNFSLKIGSTTFPLTMQNSISDGNFSGTDKVDVVITKP